VNNNSSFMNQKFSVRKATDKDAPQIIAFNIAMARETENKQLPLSVISAGVNNLFEHPEYGFYIVAELEGEIAGSLMITTEWSDWRNGLFWWIQSVYVDPRYRRRGIYRQLYDYVKQLAEDCGNICGFRLYVERDNVNAQKTYKALGMNETYYKMFEDTIS